MELGKIETIEGVDACMYVGYTGTRGAVSIPKLLYGEASPSGRLVDTFAYDLYTNPSTIYNEPVWGNSERGEASYMDKVAGIYIGYKWYETADAMGLWSAENGYEKDTRESCNILLDMVYLTQLSIGRSMASKWMGKPTQKTPQSKKTPKSILL